MESMKTFGEIELSKEKIVGKLVNHSKVTEKGNQNTQSRLLNGSKEESGTRNR